MKIWLSLFLQYKHTLLHEMLAVTSGPSMSFWGDFHAGKYKNCGRVPSYFFYYFVVNICIFSRENLVKYSLALDQNPFITLLRGLNFSWNCSKLRVHEGFNFLVKKFELFVGGISNSLPTVNVYDNAKYTWGFIMLGTPTCSYRSCKNLLRLKKNFSTMLF